MRDYLIWAHKDCFIPFATAIKHILEIAEHDISKSLLFAKPTTDILVSICALLCFVITLCIGMTNKYDYTGGGVIPVITIMVSLSHINIIKRTFL